jgi:hypothetical protein
MAKQSAGSPKRGRPTTVGATETLIAKVPPSLVAAIDAWAASAKVTRSEAMRRLIEAGLKRRPKV